MARILVVAEHQGGSFKKATLSSITFARETVGKLGGGYDIVVVGLDPTPVAQKLAQYGAEKIYTVAAGHFEPYTAQSWSYAISEVAKSISATHVVGAATSIGKDCLPRVAVRLGAGMASDVVGIGNGTYLRPMWAGNVLGEVEIKTPVHVVTVRATDFGAAEPGGVASQLVPFASTLDPSQLKMKVREIRPTVSDRPDLTEARVVIAGGRGVKSKENFALIEQLADQLNAAIGASRAAVDAEFIGNDYQVGQTGKVVAPELYIAVGISGAIQHLAGMKNSKVIVAINKDEEAPIFQVSDYGLVADLFKAVPELIDQLKARKS